MREFTIRRGLYKGQHITYDSISEAYNNGITDIKDPWWNPIVKPGDWCKADDGYIIQCLNRYKLVNKRHKSGQYTDNFQFPQGIFYVYYDKQHRPNVKNFYGEVTKAKRTTLGEGLVYGKYMNSRKKLFVTLIVEGQSPYVAYCLAFNKHTLQPNVITKHVNELLSDEQIREELMEALKPFVLQIEQRILELTNNKYVNLNDFFVEKTAKLLIKENKSPTSELAVLQFGLKLLGKQIGLTMTSSTPSSTIQEAEFKEIVPPKLGTYN